MTDSTQRNPWFDLLRGVAAFGIVGCHLSLQPRTFWGEAVHAYCELCVTAFAAVSGWFFAGKMAESSIAGWRERLGLARSRVMRLLPMYLTWTILYLIAGLAFDLVANGTPEPKFSAPGFWFDVLFRGFASSHLWFVIILLYVEVGLALVWPVKSAWWLPVALSFVCIGGIDLFHDTWWGFYPLRLFAFCLFGVGLRHGHDRHEDCSCRAASTRWIAAFGLAIVAYPLITGIGSYRDAVVIVPLVMLCGLGLPMGDGMRKVSTVVGATSLCVFLVHPMITGANGVVIRKLFAPPYGVLPVMLDWSVAWLLALAFALIAIRIPILRRIVS